MDKIAFVFSGQGDQYPGMGKELYERYLSVRQVFRTCEDMRPGTIAQCFGGSEEELAFTINTQPCLFAMEAAAAAALAEEGIRPEALAGFSLGEVTAVTVAGMVDLRTGFGLVCRRAEVMQNAADEREAAMAAVLRLEPDRVREICSEFEEVYPVNFNGPGQVTVSVPADRLPAFGERVRLEGGRVMPLKVRGGFHSPFMAGASRAFADSLEAVDLLPPELPVYSNMTARPYEGDLRRLLSGQIASPVLWEETVRNMISDGVTCFVEVGPGRTLTNMIRKIDVGVRVYSVADWDRLIGEVGRC